MKKDKKVNSHILGFHEIILNDVDLLPLDRMLFGVIAAYDNSKGCFATNKTLGSIVNACESAVSKSINKLQKKGYIIYNKDDKECGGRRHIRRIRKDLKMVKPDSRPSRAE